MLELIAALGGAAAGCLSVIPGVHAAALVAGLLPMLGAGGLAGSCFVVAAAGSAMITGALSKTFQPATRESLAGSTPEIRMAYDGRGLAAIELQNLGTMAGSAITVLLLVPVIVLGALFPDTVKDAISTLSGWLQVPLILLFTLITLVQAGNKGWTLVTMVLAGGLGFYAMGRQELMGNPASLAPLLTGIFVLPVSMMVLGQQAGALLRIPAQVPEDITPGDEANSLAPIGGMLTAITAGVGSSSAISVMAERFTEEDYLYAQASSEGANNTLALLLLILIGAGHSSSAVAVQEMSGARLDLFAGALLLFATGMGMAFGKQAVNACTNAYIRVVSRINPKLIASAVLAMSVGTVCWETGTTGLLVMLAAGSVGYAAKTCMVPNQALLMILTGPVIIQKLGLAKPLALVLGLGY